MTAETSKPISTRETSRCLKAVNRCLTGGTSICRLRLTKKQFHLEIAGAELHNTGPRGSRRLDHAPAPLPMTRVLDGDGKVLSVLSKGLRTRHRSGRIWGICKIRRRAVVDRKRGRQICIERESQVKRRIEVSDFYRGILTSIDGLLPKMLRAPVQFCHILNVRYMLSRSVICCEHDPANIFIHNP
jgi:hypothetical protein